MFIIYRQNMVRIEGKLFQPIMINWASDKCEAEIMLKNYKENDLNENNKYYIKEI